MWRAGLGLMALSTLGTAIVLAFQSQVWQAVLLFLIGAGTMLAVLDKDF